MTPEGKKSVEIADIEISNKERLVEELGLSTTTIDKTKLNDLDFTISITKTELESLKKEINSIPDVLEKINKINEFIKEKNAILSDTEKALLKQKELLENPDKIMAGGVAGIASAIGLNEIMKPELNPDGTKKTAGIDIGIFDKLGKVWDNIVMFFSGFMSKISEWLGLSKLKDSYGDIKKKIKDSAISKEEEINQKVKETEEKGKEILNNDDLKYLGGIKMLYLIKGDKSKKYTSSMLLQEEIKLKNFEELKDIYSKGPKGISSKLGLEKKGKDEEVYQSLKLLIENENFMNSILGKVNPEWRKGKISENLVKINKSGGSIIDKITNKIENSNLSLNPVDAMNQLKGIDMLNITVSEGKISFGDLEERKDLISDISNESLIKLIGTNDNIKNDDSKQRERLYGLTNQSESEQGFIDKLLIFKKDITKTMSGLFGKKIENNYLQFFNKNGLSIKELFELYMITGGKTNFDDLNSLEKSSVYLKLWKILGKDESFRGEFFDKQVIEGMEKLKIPEDVKVILGSIFSKVSEVCIEKSTAAFKEIWNAISVKDKVIIGGVIGITLIAMVKFAPMRVVGVTAVVAMITNALSTTAIANNYSKEKIKQIVEDTIKIK